MSNNFEISIEKFPHLWKMPPEIEKITRINPDNVDWKHLSVLDNHLKWLCLKFPEISNEIKNTREKIAKAMWLSSNISWEVMQAANNPDYKREFRKVA